MMSGHQSDLIRIEAIMAMVMIALNLLLVPSWGIVGAALAAAITSGIMNLWYLSEVRRKLGLLPYNRGYLRLFWPCVGLCVTLLLSKLLLRVIQPEWLAIGFSLCLAYAVFLGLALTSGLDDDDKLIADAVRARVQGWRLLGGTT
jgi:O-antigen/teichoic acid export membrane protein